MDRNATRAAKAAGYGEKNAHVEGSRLLRHPKVKAYIDAWLAKEAEAQGDALRARVDRWRREVERIAYSDAGALYDAAGELIPVSQLPEDERRVVAGVDVTAGVEDGPPLDDGAPRKAKARTIKVRRWDKMKALELLGKADGLLVERQRVEGNDGGPLVVEIRKETA